jgi:Mor family transcriptional regulator
MVDLKTIEGIITSDQNDLLEIIGLDNFLKVSKHFEGSSIYFSKNISRKLEELSIIDDLKTGKSIIDISRKYNKSVSWIREIQKKVMYVKSH